MQYVCMSVCYVYACVMDVQVCIRIWRNTDTHSVHTA